MPDYKMECVREFHAAFDCHIADKPGFPAGLDDIDLQALGTWADRLEQFAKMLKQAAGVNNLNKRTAYALLLVRLQLQVEETAELARAFANQDLTEALDALTDIDFVTKGTYLTLGLDELEARAFMAVYISNMSKLGEDGKPIIDVSGRVVKGPNYKDPKKRLKELVDSALTQAEMDRQAE